MEFTDQFRWSAAVPKSEFAHSFIQGMLDRMATSFFKYGKLSDAYPHKVSAIESLHLRLEKYRLTGNKEFLMDVANFAMIEFMHPAHADAHFRATDSNESPGRIWKGEVSGVADRNIPDKREE